MKFTTTKQRFRSLFAGFFLFGAVLFNMTYAGAQGVVQDNLDWKTVSQSIQIMADQINQLDGEMAGLTPGSPTYENVFNHLTYYKLIYDSLEGGATVPAAVQTNLALVDMNTTASNPSSPTVHDQALYDQLLIDAVALLTN